MRVKFNSILVQKAEVDQFVFSVHLGSYASVDMIMEQQGESVLISFHFCSCANSSKQPLKQ